MRLTSAGALDTAFDTDGKQTIDFAGGAAVERSETITLQTSGEVVLAGSSGDDFAVARLSGGGTRTYAVQDANFNATAVTDATVTRILSHDGFAFTLGNRYPNGDFFQNGGQPWGNGVPGFGALIIGNNGIETKSTQLLLSAQKPYTRASGWGATFAYTFTDAEQNRDINEHYSFDFPTLSIASWPPVPSTASGASPSAAS